MESYESLLDVDDSDLPSLLRPCKRKTHSIPSNSLPSPPPPATHKTLIPGPAGMVQAAIKRRAHEKEMELLAEEEEDVKKVSTQEYLEKVVECGGNGEIDDDFSRDSWVSASNFVRREGIVNGWSVVGTPLGSIKTCLGTDRIPLVVAMIKSCNPNGLGDLMVTLKDPTGTIGASIHRKFLAEGDLGKDISVGAVLVLQKVVIFSPSRTARYLNITLNNLVKVFSKDCRSPSDLTCSAPIVKHAATDPGITYHRKSGMGQKELSINQERTNEGVFNEVRAIIADVEGISSSEQMKRSKAAASRSSRDQNSARKESAALQNAAIERASTIVDAMDGAHEVVRADKESTISLKLVDEIPSVTDQEIGIVSTAVKKQERQPLISRTSLPQWTDEQLNELVVLGWDDD